MTSERATQITRLLNAPDKAAAAEQLLELLYDELRKLAEARLAREASPGLTLQPTALVHEAYLKLVGDMDASWNSRGHFFGAAAQAMRRILVDRARERHAAKRGGGRKRMELDELMTRIEEPEPEELLSLDEALGALAKLNPRAGEVVSLRCFAGLGVEETALALGVSEGTVKNDWRFARAWLRREIESRRGRVEP